MKKPFLVFIVLLLFTSLNALSQVDTIYSRGKVIPCKITEVSENLVHYTLQGEKHNNILYTNVIERIVFSNGRTQTFLANIHLEAVTSPGEWERVSITSFESDILGLYKLGEIGTKAKGTTGYSSQERVKGRAIRKLKSKAAMMGGNIVYILYMRQMGNVTSYITDNTTSSETNITGIVYASNLPDTEEFKRYLEIDNSGVIMKPRIIVSHEYRMGHSNAKFKIKQAGYDFVIAGINIENGTIYVTGSMDSGPTLTYKVTYVDNYSLRIYREDYRRSYAYLLVHM